MISQTLTQYPIESSLAFQKRKAYFLGCIKPRYEAEDAAVLAKMENALACDDVTMKDVKSFWGSILNKHIDLLNMDYFAIYNAVEPDKEKLKYYIPDSFFYAFVDEWLSTPKRSCSVDDKQLYPYLFQGVKHTKIICRKVRDCFFDEDFNSISFSKFVEICKNENEVVVKASISSYGGHRVRFFNLSEDGPAQLLAYISRPPYFNTQVYGTEYIVEKVIHQHDVMASFNPTSVNTIRVMTLMWDGKCLALSAVLRMGVNGSRVDNCSSGGLAAGLTKDGIVKPIALTSHGNKCLLHPQTGKFAGKSIPNFDKAIEMVKSLHHRFSGISKLISWDIAIGKNGDPVLVEMNITYGELDFHQYCNGPIFGELTPEILKSFKYGSYTYNSHIGNIAFI